MYNLSITAGTLVLSKSPGEGDSVTASQTWRRNTGDTQGTADRNHENRHFGPLRLRCRASGGRPPRAADRVRGEQMQYDLHVRIPGVSGEEPG